MDKSYCVEIPSELKKETKEAFNKIVDTCGSAANPSVADRIRGMTDEEMADAFKRIFNCPPWMCSPYEWCNECWMKWLKAEAELLERLLKDER